MVDMWGNASAISIKPVLNSLVEFCWPVCLDGGPDFTGDLIRDRYSQLTPCYANHSLLSFVVAVI